MSFISYSDHDDSSNNEECNSSSKEHEYGEIIDYTIDRFSGCIQAQNSTISWDFDSDSQCCENYGAYKSNKSIDVSYLLRETLLSVDIEETSDSKCDSKCALVIDTTAGKYIHKFYNYHNGYYSHNLSVYKDDFQIMEKCL